MTCEGWDARRLRGCRFAIVAVILALPLLPCTRTALYPLDSYFYPFINVACWLDGRTRTKAGNCP